MPDGLQALIARIDAAVQRATPTPSRSASNRSVRMRSARGRDAAVESAGCLIPPFEYHTLANALDEPSITLHVYGGEMTTCHVFEPAGNGRFVRRERRLSYHE